MIEKKILCMEMESPCVKCGSGKLCSICATIKRYKSWPIWREKMTNDRFRFRAWDLKQKIYWSDVQNCLLLPNLLSENILVFEQCTGLKDKKGQLIYEGDVVDILCEVEEQGVIEWDKEEAQFVVRAEQAGFVANFSNYRGTDLEVIGNIHENMELLEDNNDSKN